MGRHRAEAPSIEDFERIADEAFASLPAHFREHCLGVVIRVEDFPDKEVMKTMGLNSPFDILGLYHGRGEPYEPVNQITHYPDMIYLYRRPMLAYWSAYDDTLEEIVSHVLVHEIGHHFGLSDDDMHMIEGAQDD
ncbi:MAG: metallopeptidase family protein [Parvibaculum sp.]